MSFALFMIGISALFFTPLFLTYPHPHGTPASRIWGMITPASQTAKLVASLLDVGLGWTGTLYTLRHSTGVEIEHSYKLSLAIGGQSVPMSAADRNMIRHGVERLLKRQKEEADRRTAEDLAATMQRFAANVEQYADKVVPFRKANP